MTLRPLIDEDACLAHGDCEHVAPQVFTVNDIAEVTGPGPDHLLRQAARACPAGAIVLLDADTGEEVDP